MTRVLFLNGASSAGKTTLGRTLQDVLPDPWLLLGLDTLFHMVPERWAGGADGIFRADGFAFVDGVGADGEPELSIAYGPAGWRMMTGFHRGVAEIVRAGNPVVIDEMLLDGRARDHWFTVLAPFDPFVVGVHCSLEVLTARERLRTSRGGLARWSAHQAHTGVSYDLTVDTTRRTALDCATETADALAASRPADP